MRLRERALIIACLPSVFTGTQWALPAAASLDRLRTAIVDTLFGHNRALCAPEIVLAVLHRPHRLDPLGVILFRLLLDARRYLLKSDENYLHAVTTLALLDRGNPR